MAAFQYRKTSFQACRDRRKDNDFKLKEATLRLDIEIFFKEACETLNKAVWSKSGCPIPGGCHPRARQDGILSSLD